MINNFITGDAYKQYAHYIYDEGEFAKKNEKCDRQIPTYFVKTDYVHDFFYNLPSITTNPFILITHNSDLEINDKYAEYLKNPNLITWYSQNINFPHTKLIPIPIGIANEKWPHGDKTVLQSVIDHQYSKKRLMYANFNVATNPRQRSYCLKYIKPEYIENNVSFEKYLTHIAESYFSICPLGNGIDSHRIWESLYLKTIPIVENTYNITYLKKKYKLPIIILEDWSELSELKLNKEIYQKLIENFDPILLNTENFLT